jgi:chaperone required for assembly of F1-ATPase
MKRFWHQASAELRDGAWHILLDGKPTRLPGGAPLSVHSAVLADALAAEWQFAADGQVGNELAWNDLRLTQLAGTARQRIEPDPAPTVAALARYAESDLLCYRAEHPPALVIRQHQSWQPWLDWTAATYGAQLAITEGVRPVQQPPDALSALGGAVARLDAWTLTGLGVLVPAFGSLVLGLAVTEGALAADEAYRLSILDDIFQQSKWGLDSEVEARQVRVAREVADAARFIVLAAT